MNYNANVCLNIEKIKYNFLKCGKNTINFRHKKAHINVGKNKDKIMKLQLNYFLKNLLSKAQAPAPENTKYRKRSE